MKIIAISGPDGSGKSTQIELLKNYLESQGRRVFYFHAVEFSLANKLAGEKNNDGKPLQPMHWCGGKSVTSAGWLGIQLRKIFLKIDFWRFKKLIKKLEKSGFDYLLSDRYFYDNVINIEYLSGDFLTFDVIKPDLAIYLQASPDIIMRRQRVPDQGMEYLKKKKVLYEAKISQWNMRIIDGNRDKNVVFEEIKSLLR